MPKVTRRTALAAIVAASLPVRARAATRRPNIVFILVDDLRWDAIQAIGHHPWLQTPHLDRLTAEGARLDNAFVCISLCSPSRACFLTGCLPQRTGVLTNQGEELDTRLPSFPGLLQQAGYETGYVGKWHMGPTAMPRPGFDYWLSFRGQGVYNNPSLNENGRDFQVEGYITDLLSPYATRFIRRQRSQPFCLYLSHKAVHGPFEPPERYQNLFAGVEMPEPPTFQDDCADKPEWMRAQAVRGQNREPWNRNQNLPVPDRLPPGKWDPRSAGRLNYYRCMSAVDDSVGLVLDALRETGHLDDTLLIFTSDNGYFQGEHRRGDKRLAYEDSLRIPMLVRYPGLAQPGSVVAPMVLNLDICPTILDICGLAPPEVCQGRSIKPLLANPGQKPADWRDAWFYQYFLERAYPGLPNLQAVRTERWKYITSPDHPEAKELYDLSTDALEMHNLAADPQHAEILHDLEARLARYVAEAEAVKLPPPPPPPPPPQPKVLLSYVFDQPSDTIVDRSGAGRSGTAFGAVQQTVDGRPARVFNGRARIELDARQAPPVQNAPFWVRVTFRSEAPEGVVLAHGGQRHGYGIQLHEGKPQFVVRGGGALSVVQGGHDVTGRWVTVTGILANDNTARLSIEGELVGTVKDVARVGTLPNDGLQVGNDTGSRLGDGPAVGFRGAVASVAVGIGEEVTGV